MLETKIDVKKNLDLKKLDKFLKKAKVEIYVGFRSGQQHVITNEDGTQQAVEMPELAKSLYFGAHGIPARPFLTDGINEKKEEIRAEIEKQCRALAEDKKPNWDKVGTKAVGAIQEFVRGDYYKTRIPNSPATIKAKGSDTPLIDTAEMINALTYVIEGGDK